jgi:hypothetical protein
LTLKASGLTPTEISTDGTPADGEDGDPLLAVNLESQAPGHHQALGHHHHHPVEIGEALTVVGVGHLVPVVVRVENQVVASQVNQAPRVHHPAVETGAMEAGAHTEDGEVGDPLQVESQARVEVDPVNLESQAPGHLLAETGEALTVVGVGHPVPVVVRVENQVVASQARADPRVHHPAVEIGATEAGAHTEDGVLPHPVESQARADLSPLLAVAIGEVHPQAVETGAQEDGAAGPQAVVESLASLTAALERGIKV